MYTIEVIAKQASIDRGDIQDCPVHLRHVIKSNGVRADNYRVEAIGEFRFTVSTAGRDLADVIARKLQRFFFIELISSDY